jgi:septum formation protein
MRKIVLASQSPRRKQLMELAELQFEIVIADADENNPPGIPGHEVPEYLAKKKAAAIEAQVLLDDEILGKPKDHVDAVKILTKLSGRVHKVVTGVCMQKGDKQVSFSVTTDVHFRPLTGDQIAHYVINYKPFDKAGAYAIQEWIGTVGIEKIDGDYYSVMGLPIGEVVKRLEEF